MKATKLKNAIKDPIITKSKSLFIEENIRLFDGIANNEDQSIFNILVIKYKMPIFYDKNIRHDNKNKNLVLHIVNTQPDRIPHYLYYCNKNT